MAVWALARLAERAEFTRLHAEHAGLETDPAVRSEWAKGM
jgi:hypothetical protein